MIVLHSAAGWPGHFVDEYPIFLDDCPGLAVSCRAPRNARALNKWVFGRNRSIFDRNRSIFGRNRSIFGRNRSIAPCWSLAAIVSTLFQSASHQRPLIRK